MFGAAEGGFKPGAAPAFVGGTGVEALDGAKLPSNISLSAFIETSLFSVTGGEPLTGGAILEINDYDDETYDALVHAVNVGPIEGMNGVSDLVLVRLRG